MEAKIPAVKRPLAQPYNHACKQMEVKTKVKMRGKNRTAESRDHAAVGGSVRLDHVPVNGRMNGRMNRQIAELGNKRCHTRQS